MICPICEGQKVVRENVDGVDSLEVCLTCNGTGSISQEKYDEMVNWRDAFEKIKNAYSNRRL